MLTALLRSLRFLLFKSVSPSGINGAFIVASRAIFDYW
jgi:hypothetical protein